MRRDLPISLLLILAIAVVYLQVKDHAFITLDDHTYITDNPMVLDGLTWRGFCWAWKFY